MTLQQTIDVIQDPSVAIDDALRQVLTIGTRIHSEAIKDWARAELLGYKSNNDVPDYRRMAASNMRIRVHYSGMYGREGSHTLGYYDLPDELRFGFEDGYAVRQPARSVEAILESGSNSAIPIPGYWVAKYNALGDKAPIVFTMSNVVSAELTLDRTMFADVVSAIRTFALELLLGVESVDMHAGEAGGPTVQQNEELREVVEMHITEIHGPVTINYGDDNSFDIKYAEGDLQAVASEAEKFITPEQALELIAAIRADGGKPGENTRTFLQRVRSGSVALAANMAASGAYDGLVALLGLS